MIPSAANDAAWDVVVENLPLIEQVLRRFRGKNYRYGHDDLWSYAVEAMYRAVLNGHRANAVLATAAYRGALDGLRYLSGQDGYTRKYREWKSFPWDMEGDVPEMTKTTEEGYLHVENVATIMRDGTRKKVSMKLLRYVGYEIEEIGDLHDVSGSRVSQVIHEKKRPA